jgi:1,4-alpha-glucan branching enzyme
MPKKTPNKPLSTKSQVFSIRASGAQSVLLVGDFTQWEKKPIELKKTEADTWTVVVKLPPGKHQYRFIVDNVWRDDTEATLRVPNAFGTENSIRVV